LPSPPLAPPTDPSILLGPGERLSRRPPRSDLAVGLEAFYLHLPLDLVIPEVPEELFLIRIILADPLKASLYPTLYVPSSPRARPTETAKAAPPNRWRHPVHPSAR